MRNLTWGLIVLSAVGFVLAVVIVLLGQKIIGISSEAFSRACTNLALIAIALLLTTQKKGSE